MKRGWIVVTLVLAGCDVEVKSDPAASRRSRDAARVLEDVQRGIEAAQAKAQAERDRPKREQEAADAKVCRNHPVRAFAVQQLCTEFETNEVAALNAYGDQVVEVYGPVEWVRIDYFTGGPSVKLTQDYKSVRCEFAAPRAQEVADFQKGQEVRIRGLCVAKPVAYVTLRGCQVVR